MENQSYDENIIKNQFFQELQRRHESILDKVIENRWIICVPRSDRFEASLSDKLSEEEYCSHILVPSDDEKSDRVFKTLTGNEVQVSNRTLLIKHDNITGRPIQIHFEEIFYNDNLQKYQVWCVDDWLIEGKTGKNKDDEEPHLTNSSELSMDRLWARIGDECVYKELEKLMKDFRKVNVDLHTKPIKELKILVNNLYIKSLHILFKKDTQLEEMSDKNENFLHSILTAIESYVLHALRNTLQQAVTYQTAQEDAKLNKIINNLKEVQLHDLGIKEELHHNILRAKAKLGRLNDYSTVMGKIGCMKRAIHLVSQDDHILSADELLPILIFLVIRSSLRNWIAQVTLLKYFRFFTVSTEKTACDQTAFLITSLEAAVEHIKSESLSADSHFMHLDIVSNGSKESKSEPNSLDLFFESIKYGNVKRVKSMLQEEQTPKENTPLLKNQACHPLCSCTLCRAAWDNDSQSRSTKSSGTSLIFSKNALGYGPLHIACFYGQDDIIQILLNHGGNIDDAADVGGYTPLHCAVSRDQLSSAFLLVLHNVDCGIVDTQGNTALHIATERGHEDCVRILLHFVPNVNGMNLYGDTPLHIASKWGYIGIIELLLMYGANPRIKNRREQTPLALAHSSHITDLLNDTLSTPRPSLSCQSVKSDETSVSSSLSDGSYPFLYSEGSTKVDQLMDAIVKNDIRLVSYYLGLDGPHEQSMSHNQQVKLCHPLCNCQACALHIQRPEESPRQFALNKRKKKDVITVNATNCKGLTGLHMACAVGHTEIVQLLLDAGADVCLPGYLDGRTPLHVACLHNHPLIVDMLLNCGTCRADVKDHAYDTPLSLAVAANNSKVIEVLSRHGVSSMPVNNKCLKNSNGTNEINETQ